MAKIDWTKEELEEFYRKYPAYLGNVAQSLGVSGRGTKQELIKRILERQKDLAKHKRIVRTNMAKRRYKKNHKAGFYELLRYGIMNGHISQIEALAIVSAIDFATSYPGWLTNKDILEKYGTVPVHALVGLS